MKEVHRHALSPLLFLCIAVSTACASGGDTLFAPAVPVVVTAPGAALPQPPDLRWGMYMEAGGCGGLLSFNGELFFRDFLELRAGVGFGFSLDDTIPNTIPPVVGTFPVTVSYLTGNSPHKLELGAGVTFMPADHNTVGTGIVGYRYIMYRAVGQADLFLRVALTPFIGKSFLSDEKKFGIWGGVCAGVRF